MTGVTLTLARTIGLIGTGLLIPALQVSRATGGAGSSAFAPFDGGVIALGQFHNGQGFYVNFPASVAGKVLPEAKDGVFHWVSPDGRQTVFKTWDSLSPRVDLKSSSQPERCFEIYAHLTHSRRRVCGYFDGVMALAVSSDGQSLAFAGNLIQLARSGPPVSRFGIHIWAASTGRWTTPVRIDEVAYRAPDPPVRRLVWNNAGTALAAEMGTSITIYDVAAGTAREIVRGVLGGWSPDDRWIFFAPTRVISDSSTSSLAWSKWIRGSKRSLFPSG